MTTIAIDSSLCKRCGICLQICPMEVFEQAEKGDPVIVAKDDLCISCGQCMAICAQGAHIHSNIGRSRIVRIDPQTLPDYQNVMALIQSRRSIRRFKDTIVEKDKIIQVISAARFAPSAENFQSTKYLVLQDKLIIQRVVELAINFLEKKNNESRNSLDEHKPDDHQNKSIRNIDVILEAYKRKHDRLTFDAPTLIFFFSRIGLSFSEVNANLAIQNAMLAAHSLGLGSFYTGYIVSCCQLDENIAKLLSIPVGYEVYGAIALGYPKNKFVNYIERNNPEITWN